MGGTWLVAYFSGSARGRGYSMAVWGENERSDSRGYLLAARCEVLKDWGNCSLLFGCVEGGRSLILGDRSSKLLLGDGSLGEEVF